MHEAHPLRGKLFYYLSSFELAGCAGRLHEAHPLRGGLQLSNAVLGLHKHCTISCWRLYATAAATGLHTFNVLFNSPASKASTASLRFDEHVVLSAACCACLFRTRTRAMWTSVRSTRCVCGCCLLWAARPQFVRLNHCPSGVEGTWLPWSHGSGPVAGAAQLSTRS